MASSYRRYFIDIEASYNTKANIIKQVFTGWDFAIMHESAKERKHRASLVNIIVSGFELSCLKFFFNNHP